MEPFANVVAPLTFTMAQALESKGLVELQHLVPRYILFNLVLGMWRLHDVHNVWCPSAMCHYGGLSQLLTRREYYLIHRFANPCVTDVLLPNTKAWSDLWRWVCVVAGHDPIVPHKERKGGPLRQFIPQKPQNAGIKLHALGDPVYRFVTNVYLYASKKIQVHAGREQVGGPLTPTEVMHHCVDHLPSKLSSPMAVVEGMIWPTIWRCVTSGFYCCVKGMRRLLLCWVRS